MRFEQQKAMYETANMVNMADATAACPLMIGEAFRFKSTGTNTAPAQLADFDVLVLAPALLAIRTQQHCLDILRKGVRDSGVLAGGACGSAQRDFEGFDYHVSEVIANGDVDVVVSPLDLPPIVRPPLLPRCG